VTAHNVELSQGSHSTGQGLNTVSNRGIKEGYRIQNPIFKIDIILSSLCRIPNPILKNLIIPNTNVKIP
jgi:hypothetical protein